MKFLKRSLNTPTSTSNHVVNLELGLMPIKQEIDMRKLIFLHHIVSLHDTDPVKQLYKQQGRFEKEENWHNEIKSLKQYYKIDATENEIKKTNIRKWKEVVKNKVQTHTLETLNISCSTQKKAVHLTPYKEIKMQKYMLYMSPEEARILFRVRSGMLDIKGWRRYKYDDLVCRCCNEDDEEIYHVINKCKSVTREYEIENIYTLNVNIMKEIVKRITNFFMVMENEGEDEQ